MEKPKHLRGFPFCRFLASKHFASKLNQRRYRPLKGFIHILEIIIIVLVAFILLIQLSHIPVSESQWDRAKLQQQAWDMVFILKEKEFLKEQKLNKELDNDPNNNEISTFLSEHLPKNIIYKLEKINNTGTYIIINAYIKNPVKASLFAVQDNNEPMEIVLSLGFRF